MKNILIISGTRPEIIKLAPVYHLLRQASWADVRWLHTGQHQEMADQILRCFDVTPDITLTRKGSSLIDFSTGCREQLEAVINGGNWSLAIVQGDTESAFQGALGAFYNKVPVAHVEAGLRTHNLKRPFPEEGLRQMISRTARYHFPPTQAGRANLQAEGIIDQHIHVTGNTVVDAQHWTCKHRGVRRKIEGRGHILVTVHRRENWGGDLSEICHAIAEICRQHPEMQVLFPVHLNPLVRKPVHDILSGISNVSLTPPLDYTQMQQAIADAWVLLTDSGGLQEEAPTFGVPVLVLRDETERPEAIEAGCAILVGASRHAVVTAVNRLLSNHEEYARMSRTGNPFGDGLASQRIEKVLSHALMPASAAVQPPNPGITAAAHSSRPATV